jgi:hypothetical protein
MKKSKFLKEKYLIKLQMNQSFLKVLWQSKKAYNKNFYRWLNSVIDIPL